MGADLYRRIRRLLRPVHPKRLLYYVRHGINLLGWPHLKALVLLTLQVLRPRHIAATWRFLAGVRAATQARRQEPLLTVAVDITPFWERLTGIGWYLYRLLEELAERDDLRLRLYGPDLINTSDLPAPVVEPPAGRAIEHVRYHVPEGMSLDGGRLAGWLRTFSRRLIAADANTILFAPNYFLPESFDRCQGQLVATVHDLGFQRVPHTLREGTRRDLEVHLRGTLERAAHLLTDSETVRGELLEGGMVSPERVHTVHLAPGASASDDLTASAGDLPQGTPPSYVLHVGTLEPRKSLPTLLAAWRLLRTEAGSASSLVLCGGWGWKADELRAEINTATAEGWLHHFGYLEDAAVAALYAHADLVVLPSIYEGFGLPAIEAMAAGAPLLASDIPVLREVGGDAAAYASPEDPAAWARALGELLADPERRAKLAKLGRARARTFTWQRTAEGTAAVWRLAAGAQVSETETGPPRELLGSKEAITP